MKKFQHKIARINRSTKYLGICIIQLILILSCTSPKFTFEQEGISELQFNEGKWLLNEVLVNKKDKELSSHSTKKWKEIVQDSLFLINDIRKNKIVGSKIKFELKKNNLIDLQIGSGCDFLINTKVEILNEELSALSSPRESEYGNTIRSNEVRVEIRIYDLNEHSLISSRVAYGIIKETTREDRQNGMSFALNSEGIAKNGIDRIVNYYLKNKNPPQTK